MKKIILALLLSAPIPAQAAIIEIDISGNLYQVSSSVASQFAIGNAVTAKLILDTDVVGTIFYPDTYLFSNAVLGGFVTVNGYTATFSNAARAFVTDNEYGGSMDRFLIDDYGSAAAPVNGMAFHDFFLNWQDDSATATPSFTLPSTQAQVAAYGLPRGGIDWLTSDGNNRITFEATSVTVLPVPELASWAMMMAGMALAGASLRRRKVSVRFA